MAYNDLKVGDKVEVLVNRNNVPDTNGVTYKTFTVVGSTVGVPGKAPTYLLGTERNDWGAVCDGNTINVLRTQGYSVSEEAIAPNKWYFSVNPHHITNVLERVKDESVHNAGVEMVKATTRRTKINQAVSYAIKNNYESFVFGEFVRSELDGTEVKRVDIWVGFNDHTNTVMDYLANYVVKKEVVTPDKEIVAGQLGIRQVIYTMPGTNEEVLFNFYKPLKAEVQRDALIKHGIVSSDVDALARGRNWNALFTLAEGTPMEEVKTNAKNKKFKVLDNCSLKSESIQNLLTKGYTNMSTSSKGTTTAGLGFIDMAKDDAVDAGYRIASAQLTTAAKTAITQAIKSRKGGKRAQANAIAELLETEFGTAFVSAALGYTLTYAPMLKEHPKASRLAKEFRVKGMEIAGNEVMSTLTNALIPALMGALNGLPEVTETKVRVAEPALSEKKPSVTTEMLAEQEQHEEAAKPAAKQA